MEEQKKYEYGGCRFRFGINCTNKEKCSSCGFNPSVENARKWMINQELKHKAPDKPYRLIIREKQEE